MKRLLPLLLLPGCYDRHTQLIDAWYPGGRDAAVVDAYTAPPDAFRRPDAPRDAFAVRDVFVPPDAPFDADLHPARDAILDECSGSPNLFAFASPTVEAVYSVVWGTGFGTHTRFIANAASDSFIFDSSSPLTVGTFPATSTVLGPPPPGAMGLITGHGSSSCETTGGEVTIHEITTTIDRITRFRATFRQECGAEVRRGCVSYTAR